MTSFATKQRGEKLFEVELMYPDRDTPHTVEVGLCDVRAADSIRIFYDFQRDGWVIQQAAIFEWTIEDPVCDSDWQEVAFVQAWARERKPDEPMTPRQANHE